MSSIKPITMPKWGLAMEEGALARWAVEEGAEIALGQEIMDIETTKIANVFESPVAGVLRKKVVAEGETVPVGALLGVVSEPGVPDAEVEKFVGDFLANFKPPEKGSASGPTPEFVEAGGKRIRYLKAGPDERHADRADPRLRRRPDGLDVQPGGRSPRTGPVYAIDLPGHGGSSKDVGDGSTRDARQGRDRLHGREGDFVGASRRPFARRRGGDADRVEIAGARRGADA